MVSDLTGQVVLVHTTGFVGRGIQFFQSLARDGGAKMSRWNHVAIMVSPTECVGAEPGGVRRRPLTFFDDIAITDIEYTDSERELVVEFMRANIGKPYAYEDIPLIALALATGERTPSWLERKLSSDDRWICSELADAALAHAGLHLFTDRVPAAVYPAAMAAAFADMGVLNVKESTNGAALP